MVEQYIKKEKEFIAISTPDEWNSLVITFKLRDLTAVSMDSFGILLTIKNWWQVICVPAEYRHEVYEYIVKLWKGE